MDIHIFRGAAGSEFICEWCQPSEWTKRRPDLCVIATCPQHGRTWHYRKDAALLAAAPLLLAALEAVEWAESPFVDALEPFCPWCCCVTEGHKPDCVRQAAIAAARGPGEG